MHKNNPAALAQKVIDYLLWPRQGTAGVPGVDRPPSDASSPTPNGQVGRKRHLAKRWSVHAVRSNPRRESVISGINISDCPYGIDFPGVEMLVRMAADVVTLFDDPISNAGILLSASAQHKKSGFCIVAT